MSVNVTLILLPSLVHAILLAEISPERQ